ncbi:M24 family metallopeptidase [Streptomyces sp. GSL17-113]|uniref:M24 family metallopeptidase n=1 Tax=Streptomyces sp. GSL17-113 TaxID=3115365 RepID=UPI002E798B6E|nr:M24 family metallopeptidase [Streptomyces sp. GSL17-113]
MLPTKTGRTTAELPAFRRAQQRAYACAESVAARLRPGTTEREAARMQLEWLREHGGVNRSRPPLAWFGDRTVLPAPAGLGRTAGLSRTAGLAGCAPPRRLLPTDRKLAASMPFVLDMAPVLAGRTTVVGYSGCLGPDPVHERLMTDLRAHRELLLRRVRERRTLRELHEEVERLSAVQGYGTPPHTRPLGALLHPVAASPYERESGPAHRLPPRWSGRYGCRAPDLPPRPGLWVAEPHLWFRGTGAKFAELLVVTDSRDPEQSAFWLDDDLPHVRRWQEEAQAV